MLPDAGPALLAAGRVLAFGDLHGDTLAFRVLAERADDLGLRVLVSVGDLGIGPWPGETQDKMLRRADDLLDRLDAWLLLTPGNHENWDTIDHAVAQRRDGLGFGILGRHGRVRVSPRGHRFTIGGRRFGSLGGAISVDRGHRAPGRSWWLQEVITAEHVAALGAEPLDVLVTHEVPTGVPMRPTMTGLPAEVLADAQAGRDLIAQAVANTSPSVALSGHWHIRLTHELARPDGVTTRVEVLSEEHTAGNAVVLDLDHLSVTSLPSLWRGHFLDT